MSSHEDCTADNVDESIDNILDLPDGFEAEMLPDDSQVRSVIADEPDGESGVAGRPDRPDQQPVPDSDVRCIIAGEPDLSGVEEITGSSDDDWRQIFSASAHMSNRGAVESFNDSFQQDAEQSFLYVTPLKESNVEDLVEGIIEDQSHTLTQLTPMQVGVLQPSETSQVGVFQPSETSQVGEGTADTVHSKRYSHKYT